MVDSLTSPAMSSPTTTAASLARTWLADVFETMARHGAPTAQPVCEALLGLWLCDHLLEDRTPSPCFREVAARARDLLPPGGDGFAGVPPTLQLFASFLLTRAGAAHPYLDGYARLTAEVLDGWTPDDPAEERALLEKQVLLHAAGLSRAPRLVTRAEVIAVAERLALPADPAWVADLVLDVEAATGWGTRSLSLLPGEAWLVGLLRGLATDAFRQYDIAGGCRLFRALIHVDCPGTVDEFRDYVLLQQRLEGAFGFFGPEEAALRARAPEADTTLALSLPVTVQCLWSLAEAVDPAWRLFRELPQRRDD
ncbi:MAG TPA: hypothetical protein VM450_05215 [Thermomicrobiales bacterium]|nr:hypothetical protein [Thermomicrobiales bacterium]